MEKVRLGIIGVGNMGSSHIRNYLKNEMPEFIITAVCDVKDDRLEWAKEQLPDVKTFKDASALMFVTYKGDAKVGDKVFIAGEKVTNGGIASVNAGQVDILSSAEVSHPSPIDLLANLDPANADKVLYV